MAAAERAMRQEDRERAGLVNLGLGALDLAAAMDAAQARVLTQVRADAATGTLAGQIAGIGPLAPEPGFNSWLVFGTLISSLDDFAREPKSATVEMPPETVEIAGNTGTITSTLTLNAVVGGSQLSVDLTMKTKGQVVDRATGAVLYSIDSIVSGHIDLDFCPDTSGRAAANVKLTSSEIYVTGGAGGSSAKGIAKEFSGSVGIAVGDDANIVKVEGAAQGSEDSKGGVTPAGGGEAELTASTRTASDNIANDGKGRRLPDVPRDIQYGGEGSSPADQVKLWGSMTIMVETMVTAAAKEAEKLWKSGKCVELLIDPDGGDVEADEVKDVTAKLRHKIEGNELDKPVEATFAGVKSLTPLGEKQPAPATVSFTAGPKQGDWGRISFKSVSNRGIAEKDAIFTVGSTGWNVEFRGTESATGNSGMGLTALSLKAVLTGLKVTVKDGELSGTGDLHLSGTHTAGCFKGHLDQVVPIVLQGTLVGSGPEAKLRVWFSRPTPTNGTITMNCPKVVAVKMPDNSYSELFWYGVDTVELPAAGGTVAFDRTATNLLLNVTVAGTFTVTRVK